VVGAPKVRGSMKQLLYAFTDWAILGVAAGVVIATVMLSVFWVRYILYMLAHRGSSAPPFEAYVAYITAVFAGSLLVVGAELLLVRWFAGYMGG